MNQVKDKIVGYHVCGHSALRPHRQDCGDDGDVGGGDASAGGCGAARGDSWCQARLQRGSLEICASKGRWERFPAGAASQLVDKRSGSRVVSGSGGPVLPATV